jgi:hypothetical protein
MMEGPTFKVKLDHGHTSAFKKAMKKYDVEIVAYHQVNKKEFTVTFEEPTTTILDAKDFYPNATWSEINETEK